VADRVAEAMQDLYAVGPDEFMATRSRLVAEAKAASDTAAATEIGRLRKPSLAAWAVNLTAREAEDVVADLVDLGERMRSAQSRLDAAALTGMRKERDATVEVYVRAATRAVSDAGRSLSAAAQQEVRATAIAALADEQASAAVTSGQLTRSLSYSGFGEVDLAEALARTTGGAILTVVPGGRGSGPAGRSGGGRKAAGSGASGRSAAGQGRGPEGDGDDATAGAEHAVGTEGARDDAADLRAEREAELAEAERRLADAERAVTAAREKAEETRERLAVVERQLAKAREADERALEGVTDAVRERKRAQAARDDARQALAAPD
jgi:hypothetical protein